MADNVQLSTNVGVGEVCATDQVTGTNEHVQLVKLAIAADGSRALIPADAANGIDVDITRIAAGDTNIGNVDIVTVPAPLSTTGGGVEATALRVTLASDSTGVVSVDDNGGALTVDGTVTANLGTIADVATQTTLAAINAKLVTGTDIGDVTINNAAGAAAVNVQDGGNTLTVDGTVAATQSGAWDVGTLTTITNVVHVDDNAGALTVDGTITANAGTNLNTSTLALEAGGNLAAAATSLAILDDWDNAASDGASVSGDVAHDSPDAGEPVKVGFKNKLFDGSAPGTTVSAEDDRANAICDGYGRQYVEITHPNFWQVSADYAAAQTNTSVKAAPGANLCLFITDLVISNGATAGNVTLLDGSGGTVLFEIYPAINGGVSHQFRTPIKLTAATALCITSTTVTTHSVNVGGFTAAVTGGV